MVDPERTGFHNLLMISFGLCHHYCPPCTPLRPNVQEARLRHKNSESTSTAIRERLVEHFGKDALPLPPGELRAHDAINMIFAARRKPLQYARKPNAWSSSARKVQAISDKTVPSVKARGSEEPWACLLTLNKKVYSWSRAAWVCGQTGGRDAVGEQTHISQAQRVAELDGSGVAAVHRRCPA